MLNELQRRWLQNQLIGIDVIVKDSGHVKLIDITYTHNENLIDTFKKEYVISYGADTALPKLLQDYKDPWANYQINDRISVDDQFVFCGEGEMGNEGFIVKTDADNQINWMLFSTTSNPFIELTTNNNSVYINSTAGFFITLNVKTNEISILNNLE
ncbi:hypothetical protein G0Q57_001916 [Listeria monocytogenes]|nr:hypothetical protein [Listeria monocytogenes]EAE3627449.1 hypothetical protein [Listeria monocytogenes]EAE5910298.1 hypothetical protein [Listeria monocytogenes]EDN8357105.1 hypothetical protein [Listeria monocytogenes]EDN8374924.1 hypothetical protein [Listeria monocytogenes]